MARIPVRGTESRSPIRLIAVAVGISLLAACAPGAAGGVTRPAQRAPGDIQTDPARLGKTKLVVWDQETRPGSDRAMNQLNEEFMAKYPNIRIERVARSYDDSKTTLKLALSGENPPDVVQANNARSDMGAFVPAGLLQPLDSYARRYGWFERFPASVLQFATFTDDGKTYGEGSLYGVPQSGEIVGMFYNKDKLAELGLSPPQTWEQFDAALAKAKRAGKLPLQFGNLDQIGGVHLTGTVLSRYMTPRQARALALGQPGASWTSAGGTAAADYMVALADNGYLPPGFNGLTADDAAAKFGEGEGVFLMNGTWMLSDLSEALGDRVGFTVLRGHNGEPTAIGGTGLPWSIPAKSRDHDAAAAYIDFVTGKRAMNLLQRNQTLTVVPPTDPAREVPALQEAITRQWRAITAGRQLLPYPDYATPSFWDTLTASAQDLLAKQQAPREFLEVLQDDYAGFLEVGGG